MHADPELGGECTLGDLAIDGGPGQAGSVEDCVQADDTVWLGHGMSGSCWLFLGNLEPVSPRYVDRARAPGPSSQLGV